MVSLLVVSRHLKFLIVAASLAAAVVSVAGQDGPLRVVRADPRGDLATPADASQIRIVFSEPMVALGTPPPGAAPSWFHISPELRGAFYWSGTDTLVFSPDAATPLPQVATFTVRIDAAAADLSGRPLAAPYVFTFTTPAARLSGVKWYRRDGNAGNPLVIMLRFDQPVRADAMIAQTRVRLEAHKWTAPALSPRARADLRRRDPAGLRRFDEKVAAVRRAVSRSETLAILPAPSWDRDRAVAGPDLVVIETATAPPRDGKISIATPGNPSWDLWLEPTFFVTGPSCQLECGPNPNPIGMTQGVAIGAFAQALSVADFTAPANARTVIAAGKPPAEIAEVVRSRLSPADAGFGDQPTARTWRLQLSPDLRADDGQTLGYPWVEFVETTAGEPYVALDGSVVDAASGAQLPVFTRNVQALHESLAPISPSDLVARLHELNERKPRPVSARPRRLDVTPDADQRHLIDLRSLLAPRQTGLVWFDVALEQLSWLTKRAELNVVVKPWSLPDRARAVIQVTNLGITMKEGPFSRLLFVTRLDTGEPVDNARVALVDDGNQTRWSGPTDRDGVAFVSRDALGRGADDWLAITAEKDGDIAFVTSHSPRAVPGIYMTGGGETPGVRGSVFTDRGVYRPGEDVHFKAILREDTPEGMRALPDRSEFDVIVDDARGREAGRQRVVLNRWSSAEWTWRAPDNGGLGAYRVKVLAAGADPEDDAIATAGFRVAAFRRPEFRVDTTLAGDPPILGSTLRGGIQASYLFGAALASRPIRWFWHREPVQRPPDAVLEHYPGDRYVIGYRPDTYGRQERSVEAETSLGPDGRLAVAIPTESADAAYEYHLEADVEGESRQHIASRTSTIAHPSSLYVAVSRPPVFVDQKSGTAVRIAAVDLAGRTLADVDVRVTLVRHTWAYTRKMQPAGLTGEWVLQEIPSGEWTVRTSSSTEAALPIQVREGGWHVIRLTARDAAGRQTRTESGFYATGSGRASWRLDDDNRITLVPERDRWKPGETARILVQSPWPSATALLTVEREGIRTHRRFAVTSTQDVVDVPITEADVPNVYVSVVLVKGRTASDSASEKDPGAPAYRVGHVELEVDDASKRLGVAVSADREDYRPRDPITVSVALTTPRGKPAAGEVTLWAVDLGVLSLTGYTTPDLVKALYVPKALRVFTRDTRSMLAGRGPIDLRKYMRWSGDSIQTSMGSRATLLGETVEDVREDFRPLAFWIGSAATDASGRVTTSVTLPDSLTTYRIMAVASDDDSRFGLGEHEVRVTKPLTLLAAFPRFLNTGDRAALGAVVTNGSATEGTAVVTIRSLDPGTLRFTETRQSVHLAAGASQPVSFGAVGAAAGSARVTLSATLGSATDALQVPVTVARPLVRETTAAYGETTAAGATERLTVVEGALRDRGGLTVELASTALVGLGEGVRYLSQYPYGCAEQKSSRALALLLASDLGGAFTLPDVKPADSRTSATSLLRSLSNHQCSDGGYGMWSGSCATGSPYLTAYVLHVMKIAQTLGVEVDARAIEEALDFLERDADRSSSESRWWPAWAVSQAYALKVLAEFGRTPGRGLDELIREADRLPLVALSHVADALAASRDKGPRYQDLIRRLTNAIRVNADRAHVEERDANELSWIWNTNVTSTAVALEGFARRKDNMTLAAPLARWLLAEQKNSRWNTTHDNALAFEALVKYYRVFEQDVPHMTAQVSVGSASIGGASFDGRSAEAQRIEVPMADLLKHAASPSLSVSRAGTGRLFYTARVDAFTPAPAAAADRGFQVERRYERHGKGAAGGPVTSFAAGDLIRVTVSLTLRGEGRYLALTDPLPAGFEPLDDWALTTASDLAARTRQMEAGDWQSHWYGGYFDHVEKHDDRVLAFATALAPGRHEFSYLVRATTAGTFEVSGASVEAMYAPDVTGRSAAATVTVR